MHMSDVEEDVKKLETLSVDEFRSIIRSTAPSCAICGFTDFSLVDHLRSRHSLSAGQYIKKFPSSSLSAPIVQELFLRLGQKPFERQVPLEELIGLYKGTEGRMGLNYRLDEIKNTILSWFSLPPSLSPLVPLLKPSFFFTSNAPLIALAIHKGKNLLISGPSGTGKTQELLQVLSYIGMPVRRTNMHMDVTYSSFIGQMRASPSQGTYFQYGFLPSAMKEGYPVIIDEIDFTPPALAALLHPVLESEGVLFIPETQEWITPKRGFTVLATSNTRGKGDNLGVYTGTEVQNTAFLNRFTFKLDSSHLPPFEEERIVRNYYPSSDPLLVTTIVKLANEVRVAHENSELGVTWSIRNILDFFDLEPILGIKEALHVTLLNWFDSEDRPLVQNIIQRVGIKEFPPI